MFAYAALVVFASSALPTAFAHGGVLAYSNAGKWYQGWNPYNSAAGQTGIQRPWSSYNPIQDATAATLACNNDGAAGALQQTGTVAAGSDITAYWNQIWPHNTGPMLTYLSSCGSSCDGVDASKAKWFKIDEAGLLSGPVYTGQWASGQMIAQNSSWTTTIPASVPSGNYLIRFETIALHSMPAQFYPECAQIQITGGGSLAPTPAELVTFPGGYSNSDPGVNIDLYSNAAQTQYTYTIPGPPLYAGAKPRSTPSSAPHSSAPASTSKPPATSSKPPASSSKPPASSSAPIPSSSNSATVAQFGQCGGQSYTGPTLCAAGLTCTAQNAYYSQCL